MNYPTGYTDLLNSWAMRRLKLHSINQFHILFHFLVKNLFFSCGSNSSQNLHIYYSICLLFIFSLEKISFLVIRFSTIVYMFCLPIWAISSLICFQFQRRTYNKIGSMAKNTISLFLFDCFLLCSIPLICLTNVLKSFALSRSFITWIEYFSFDFRKVSYRS